MLDFRFMFGRVSCGVEAIVVSDVDCGLMTLSKAVSWLVNVSRGEVTQNSAVNCGQLSSDDSTSAKYGPASRRRRL